MSEANSNKEQGSALKQENLKIYTEVLHKEAASLLAKYLPEALPQEPTEILIGFSPIYFGKFKEKHYIGLEQDEDEDPMVQMLKEAVNEQAQSIGWLELWGELEKERIRLINERAEKGPVDDSDLEEIDEIIDRKQDEISKTPKPETKIEDEKKDWQDPEKLSKGPSQYSDKTWRDIYSLIHELIHQRQAELHPSAFPLLNSPELEEIDPDTVDRSKLYDLLLEAQRTRNRAEDNDSLFYPIIEGTAAVGAFYIMGRYAEYLLSSGEVDAANKIRIIKRTVIFDEVVRSKRDVRAGKGKYDIYYVNGVSMIRKIYKHFGLENTPRVLTKVDLTACRQIPRGSSEYQEIMENPTLLPGLPQAA